MFTENHAGLKSLQSTNQNLRSCIDQGVLLTGQSQRKAFLGSSCRKGLNSDLNTRWSGIKPTKAFRPADGSSLNIDEPAERTPTEARCNCPQLPLKSVANFNSPHRMCRDPQPQSASTLEYDEIWTGCFKPQNYLLPLAILLRAVNRSGVLAGSRVRFRLVMGRDDVWPREQSKQPDRWPLRSKIETEALTLASGQPGRCAPDMPPSLARVAFASLRQTCHSFVRA